MKRCYYEVLQVDRKATPAEIKTNYRKMALKYHPDKNSDDGAKERFVQINEAYNVLSDPNERTWYDNNREKLLFNKEEMSKEDVDQYTFGFNIWHYFTTGCFNGYDDSPTAFYAVYRDVFEKIKAEETKAYSLRDDIEEQQRKLEGFGDSSTSEQRVLKFYEDWENFATYKTFVWSEEWDTREAGSRWVRREMEKENKKQRQGEKKNYVKTIKDLLAYVRKRDPRFIAYVARLKEEQEKKQQQRLQREKEKLKEKEQMKHVKQRLEEERFREIEEYYRQQAQQNSPHHAQHSHAYQEESQAEFYCEVCEKEFKSENQLRNHQKSKQHKQMIKDIEKEVLLKEEKLQRAQQEDKDEEQITQEQNNAKHEQQPEQQPSPKKKRNKKKKNQQKKGEDEDSEEEIKPQQVKPVAKQEQKNEPAKQQNKPRQDTSSDDQDHFMNTLLNNRNKQQPKQVQPPPPPPQSKKVKESESEEEGEKEDKQVGKAKLKKQKKAQQEKAGKGSELKCKSCGQTFSSKTKLFQHLNKTGHASAK